jgi:hypothetical protein
VISGTRGEALLPVVPFKLDPTRPEAPCHFELELCLSGKHYSYGFEATTKRIETEWLHEIGGGGEETLLFEREAGNGAPRVTIGEALSADPKRQQFMAFVAEGTRQNQLFLAEAGERNVLELLPIRRDFQSWTLVLPDAPYLPLIGQLQKDEAFRKLMGSVLKEAGTGIEDLEVRTHAFPLDELPENMASAFRLSMNMRPSPDNFFAAGAAQSLAHDLSAELRRDDQGRTEIARLFSVHELPGGERVELSMSEESDGTRRLLNLAPILHLMGQEGPDTFFAVDELERSLHPLLTRMLLQLFFARTGSGAGAQLLFTTHDTNLLDHRILSRDSIWLMEKDARKGSLMYPLSELDQAQINEVEQQGKGLERGYLQGRFGAIPFFGSLEALGFRKDLLK